MGKTYAYTEGTSNDTIEVSDECLVSMDDSKFQIDIQASNYADQVYTLNYIENIFDNLNNLFDGCKRLITSAKNYINENMSIADSIEQPDILDFDFSITGTNVLSEKSVEMIGAETGIVKVGTSLNFRSGPGKNYDIIGSLKNDAKLTLTGNKSGEWIKVITEDGKTGYVSKEYVNITNPNKNTTPVTPEISPEMSVPKYAKVGNMENSTHLRVRSSPNANSQENIIGNLNIDAEVEILDATSNPKWTKIKYNGQEAYVFKKYLTELK